MNPAGSLWSRSPIGFKCYNRLMGASWSSYQGPQKTLSNLLKGFFWPRIYHDTQSFHWSYPSCQLGSSRQPAWAPLQPLPLVETPFEKMAMDFVGPLPCSS